MAGASPATHGRGARGTSHGRGARAAWVALAAAILLVAGAAAAAETSEVNPKLTESNPKWGRDSISVKDLKEWVKYLASDELKGRAAYTPECDVAADWIGAQFKAWGLKPVGPGETYFQPIASMRKVKELGPKTSLRLFKGKDDAEGRAFEKGKEFSPHPYGKAGEAEGSVVFAGYGITAPGLKYDDYEGLDAKGKIVLLFRYTPKPNKEGSIFSGQDFLRYASLQHKIENAKEHGAIAVLMVRGPVNHENEPEKLDSPVGAPQGPTGALPMAQVLIPVADALFAAGGMDDTAKVQKGIEDTCIPASRELKDVRAKLVSDLVQEEAGTRNVVALLEGSDPKLKDEVVVVGAHYDHVGVGAFASRDGRAGFGKVHYGADDNASGTVGVMAVAKALAANPVRPRRSVLFMAFTGEERGLLGSQHYVDHPLLPLKQTIAMVNLDMIGRCRDGQVTVSGIGTSPAFKPILAEAAKAYPTLKLSYGSSGYAPSDNSSFYSRGVPVLFFNTGLHNDYHTPRDTWDKLDLDSQACICWLCYDLVVALAERAERPAYVEAAKGPYLGVNLGKGEDGKGAVVTGIAPGSPARKAGLLPGDIICKFGGKMVRGSNDLVSLLTDHKPDETVDVTVLRDGHEAELKLTLGSRGR